MEIVRVYGKAGCKICDAAKDKMKRLRIEYEFYDLDVLSSGNSRWRTVGAVPAMAEYQLRGVLPIITIGDWLGTYSEAMAKLKGMKK